MTGPNEYIGLFVTADAGLGTGRLDNLDPDGRATVKYFRGPSATRLYVLRECPAEDVRPVTLASQTRVYIPHEGGWLVGRVDGPDAHNGRSCVVALPNRDGAPMDISDFEVRWDPPIEDPLDPFEILSALGGESAKVCDQRADLLAGWHRQRAASSGAEGLFLSSVGLHSYQLSTVRRVTDDPTRRYLLADEVGLGKTIEAGALIWQYLREVPEATVLILAPGQLHRQWETELEDKFSVSDVRVLAHEELGSWPGDPVDVLVVDEAHHLTRAGSPTDAMIEGVTLLAQGADMVLLLSATPVRSNEVGFLDLLHLLDPENYRRDHVDQFRERVERRDELARTYQSLDPELEHADWEIRMTGEALRDGFPHDARLSELLTAAEDSEDGSRPEKIARVREHLSETYRIHHRLLRTRRTRMTGSGQQIEHADPDAESLNPTLVRGRKRWSPFNLDIPDESDTAREELLDSFCLHLSILLENGEVPERDAVEAFRDVANRCGSTPHALARIAADQGPASTSTGGTPVNPLFNTWARDGGRIFVSRVTDALDDVTNNVSEVLCNETLAKQQRIKKAVIFSSFPEVAAGVSEAVIGRWNAPGRVVTHLQAMGRDDNAESMRQWLKDPECTLLFCDDSAEEGVNLQTADLLIHLDLPWESARLDQRIGRGDRYVPRWTGPIPSAIVHYGYQSYARNWFSFLADGCRVFEETISSLQYVLADTEFALLRRVLTGGAGVLEEAVDEQAGILASELENIRAHDALDSFDSHHDASNDALLACDSDPSFTEALTDWLGGVDVKKKNPLPGICHFYVPKNGRPQVPLDLERRISPWFDTRLSLTRSAAVEHGYPILRAGNPMVDAIAAHLHDAERGVVFAFLRPFDQWPPVVIFRTDFLILPGPDTSLYETASSVGLEAWVKRQVGTSMPPMVESVFLTEDGRAPPEPRRYDKSTGDVNLTSRPELFGRLVQALDWPSACADALEMARAGLAGRTSVSEAPLEGAESLRREIDRRSGRRMARNETDLTVESDIDLTELADSVPEQLDQDIRLLGCGAIILANPGRVQ